MSQTSDRDELVARAVVVAEAAGDALADNVVRLAGGKPGDVGVSVVERQDIGFKKVSAGCGLGIQPPDRDDADRALVLPVWVVVDGLEGRAVSGHASDQPLRPAVVDLSVGMAVRIASSTSDESRRRSPRRISACSVQTKRSISTTKA